MGRATSTLPPHVSGQRGDSRWGRGTYVRAGGPTSRWQRGRRMSHLPTLTLPRYLGKVLPCLYIRPLLLGLRVCKSTSDVKRRALKTDKELSSLVTSVLS